MRYVTSKAKEKNEEAAYRFYITDCLRDITENTARAAHGGPYITVRFADMLANSKKPRDTRTPQQIIDERIKKLGLEVVDDG